jgi:predicted anti-sigma-YlaC factor YlaD
MTPSLSCVKAAELMSQALDEPLGVVDTLRLKYHLSICDDCRNVDEQFKQLSGFMHSPDAFNGVDATGLNPEDKSQV